MYYFQVAAKAKEAAGTELASTLLQEILDVDPSTPLPQEAVSGRWITDCLHNTDLI